MRAKSHPVRIGLSHHQAVSSSRRLRKLRVETLQVMTRRQAEIEEPVNTEVDPEEMLRDYALSQLSRMVAAGEVDDDLAASLRDVDPRIILEMSRKHG